MVLIISNFQKKCLKRAIGANVQKRSLFFLEHPVSYKLLSLIIIITIIMILLLLITYHYYYYYCSSYPTRQQCFHYFSYPFFNYCFIMTAFIILTSTLTFIISFHSSHFYLSSYSSWHLFQVNSRRDNKSQRQVQRSHFIPLVFKFYVLVFIYFRATFMEIFLNIFI